MINYNQENLNGVRNSNKLKNPAAPGSGKLFSLSTGAAEILIFVILRVALKFFISRDVCGWSMSPTLVVVHHLLTTKISNASPECYASPT